MPFKWKMVLRPRWDDLPYFTRTDIPLVTSINLLHSSRKRRKKRSDDLVDVFRRVCQEPLPDGWEVLVNGPDLDDGFSVATPEVLFVDHHRQLASQEMAELQPRSLVVLRDEKDESPVASDFGTPQMGQGMCCRCLLRTCATVLTV